MAKFNLVSGIPHSAAPFFQEYQFESLDPESHRGLIIERILTYGNRRETCWLFNRYGKPVIAAWLQEEGSFKLPIRRYLLFCVLLDLGPVVHPRVKRRIWPY